MKSTNQKNQNKNIASDKLSLDNPSGLTSIHSESKQRLSTGPHQPVLLRAVLKYLNPMDGESYLDLTAGYGGHAKAILAETSQPERAILVDRDQQAVDYLKPQFEDHGVRIVHQDFLNVTRELMAEGHQFDIILADLGVSSPHLDSSSRGFSVGRDGPLDMRMDRRQTTTAADIVNNYNQAELVRIIHEYGEEPRANQIARLIVAHRPYITTQQLAAVVARAWPGHSKRHPALRTFQALRIAVNDELGQLEQALPLWTDLLEPGGRLAVISFHSLEDRIVKQAFVDKAGERYDAVLQLLTKQPVTAEESELVLNPRARSAKLRAVVKINKKGDK